MKKIEMFEQAKQVVNGLFQSGLEPAEQRTVLRIALEAIATQGDVIGERR
jgi:hypothetical protein